MLEALEEFPVDRLRVVVISTEFRLLLFLNDSGSGLLWFDGCFAFVMNVKQVNLTKYLLMFCFGKIPTSWFDVVVAVAIFNNNVDDTTNTIIPNSMFTINWFKYYFTDYTVPHWWCINTMLNDFLFLFFFWFGFNFEIGNLHWVNSSIIIIGTHVFTHNPHKRTYARIRQAYIYFVFASINIDLFVYEWLKLAPLSKLSLNLLRICHYHLKWRLLLLTLLPLPLNCKNFINFEWKYSVQVNTLGIKQTAVNW